ncbi:hypothetical protein HBA55_29585 [Pseudomaricurvus alkylphenolicus]|uniref:hypothetical protein n=1 Tax=Pseudomaricurvus alkylphenolicus TaxID=1306991 RepID=UPI00141EE04A|nr:hypothetical protein [Pseudomaricurvus alkylphenolicus]NIB43791.1 hypothetical protein [Pseudomaricurvus alkylphenolicus]
MSKTVQLTKDKYGYITPKNDEDLPLFKHCSEGMYAVTEEYYLKVTEPMMKIHGITRWEHDWI